MSRITLSMSGLDVIIEMAEGNPGAVSVLSTILKESAKIDPDNMLGGLGPILMMGTYRIYGHRIWMLYKDVCKEDIATTIALVRATQMGLLTITELNHAIDNRGDGIDLVKVCAELKAELPSFGESLLV